MGELHLDIIAERIRTQFKVDASLGPLQIAYRESVKGSASYTGMWYALHVSVYHNAEQHTCLYIR